MMTLAALAKLAAKQKSATSTNRNTTNHATDKPNPVASTPSASSPAAASSTVDGSNPARVPQVQTQSPVASSLPSKQARSSCPASSQTQGTTAQANPAVPVTPPKIQPSSTAQETQQVNAPTKVTLNSNPNQPDASSKRRSSLLAKRRAVAAGLFPTKPTSPASPTTQSATTTAAAVAIEQANQSANQLTRTNAELKSATNANPAGSAPSARLASLPAKQSEKLTITGRVAKLLGVDDLDGGVDLVMTADPAAPTAPSDPTAVTYEMLNAEQRQAVDYMAKGKSFNLVGGAGSGKTTTQGVALQTLADSGQLRALPEDTKYLTKGTPSVAILSFTNKAVEKIRTVVPEHLKANCLTAHKFLEYQPEDYDEEQEDGTTRIKRRWVVGRHADNPIRGLTHIIIEECSNVGFNILYRKIREAVPYPVAYVFMGDLNQLQPVGDTATLGYSMCYLPTVELKKVYRQGSESPIKTLASLILEGNPISTEQLKELAAPNQLTVLPLAKELVPELQITQLGSYYRKLAREDRFNPANSVVLLPYHKGGECNVLALNKYIAQGFTDHTKKEVFEIYAGRNTLYLSEGDYVMHEKQMWKIDSLGFNPKYVGKHPRPPSPYLTRWGKMVIPREHTTSVATDAHMNGLSEVDILLDGLEDMIIDDSTSEQATHILTLSPVAGHNAHPEDHTTLVSRIGEYADLCHAYSMTVHKSQGSEWKNVHYVTVREHQKSVRREHMYTAVTRASQHLTLIFADRLVKGGAVHQSIYHTGVVRQEIPGRTTIAKIPHFERLAKRYEQTEVLKTKAQAHKESWPDTRVERELASIKPIKDHFPLED